MVLIAILLDIFSIFWFSHAGAMAGDSLEAGAAAPPDPGLDEFTAGERSKYPLLNAKNPFSVPDSITAEMEHYRQSGNIPGNPIPAPAHAVNRWATTK